MFNRNLDIKREKIIDGLFGEEKDYWNIYDNQQIYTDLERYKKLMDRVKDDLGGKVSKIEIVVVLLLILIIVFVKEPIVRYGAGVYIFYWFVNVLGGVSILDGIHIGWDAKKRITDKQIFELQEKCHNLEEQLEKVKSRKKRSKK